MTTHVTMTDKTEILEALKGEVVISCQALPEEPLHSAYIMGRMAYAAMLAGAKGIRANSVVDIKKLKPPWTSPLLELLRRFTGTILYSLPPPWWK